MALWGMSLEAILSTPPGMVTVVARSRPSPLNTRIFTSAIVISWTQVSDKCTACPRSAARKPVITSTLVPYGHRALIPVNPSGMNGQPTGT